ncbi:MAG: hypothetical protein NC211_06335 [Alistipes senegalensis]|nr:hypothetical protein [Oxalobacter formigenes]MCM1281428.1 hypothetical protein [Alistipes senegalensis]
MAIDVSSGYSQFYVGTEQIKGYGSSSVVKKETLVKYQFNTTDEDGNKVMDKMSREETIQALNVISSQYGESVIVQISGDGLAALVEDGKCMSKRAMTAEEAVQKAERDREFQKEIIPLNAHRIVIPDAEVNTQLYSSLAGAPDSVVSSAMGIISAYLMSGDVSGLSEQERKDMVAFGLESARYLAENYLDDAHAAGFMSAMEAIARYGLNGSVSDSGKVVYNWPEEPTRMSGAPNGYVDMERWLKANDAELYNQINELNQSILNGEGGGNHAARFMELYTRATKEILSAPSGKTAGNNDADLKEKVNKTALPVSFQNVRYDDFSSFLASLQNQSSLSNSWITENVGMLMKWLTV